MSLADCIRRAGHSLASAEATDSLYVEIVPAIERPFRGIPAWTFHPEQGRVNSTKQVGPDGMKYAVVIESSETGYSAYVPDLPGCVVVGESIDETERLIQEAVEFHLDGLREDGMAVSPGTTWAKYVEVA